MKVATKAAREAGRLLLSRYGKIHPHFKKDRSVVTEADLESEKLIKSVLEKEFPDYSFLGEESGIDEKSGDYLWVVDPLDGTTNYMIKNPFFDVSIGLVYKGTPILGVVYYPIADDLFTAMKGGGAYLNGEKIKVSNKLTLADSVITFCNNRSGAAIKRMAPLFLEIKLITNKLRQLGAGALEMSFVAGGRTESFFMPDTNIWDVAAGTVLVREAGGLVTDFEGNPYSAESKDIVASNGIIHNEILGILMNR
jgi:myo-inositol-1(or 4)-monophosphatase